MQLWCGKELSCATISSNTFSTFTILMVILLPMFCLYLVPQSCHHFSPKQVYSESLFPPLLFLNALSRSSGDPLLASLYNPGKYIPPSHLNGHIPDKESSQPNERPYYCKIIMKLKSRRLILILLLILVVASATVTTKLWPPCRVFKARHNQRGIFAIACGHIATLYYYGDLPSKY